MNTEKYVSTLIQSTPKGYEYIFSSEANLLNYGDQKWKNRQK